MADAYWGFNDARQLPMSSVAGGKRPRSDFDVPVINDLSNYFSTRDDERLNNGALRDTESIEASYERYLRSMQISSYSGGESARPFSAGPVSHAVENQHPVGIGVMESMGTVKGRNMGVDSGRPGVPLPPDASSTLFVEGLPANCARREVAHIFRPFVGYKEVRVVTKDPKHPGGEPIVISFVDFASPAHAATAMDALQGYKFDEEDRNSGCLRLQFARYPGARAGGGYRGPHSNRRDLRQ